MTLAAGQMVVFYAGSKIDMLAPPVEQNCLKLQIRAASGELLACDPALVLRRCAPQIRNL